MCYWFELSHLQSSWGASFTGLSFYEGDLLLYEHAERERSREV